MRAPWRARVVKAGVLTVVGLFGVGAVARDAGAAPLGGLGYSPLSPVRVLDTRAGGVTVDGLFAGGGALGGGATMNVRVTGRGGVPAAGVGAVVLNVTAVNQSAATFLTVWPKGTPRPVASNLNPVSYTHLTLPTNREV